MEKVFEADFYKEKTIEWIKDWFKNKSGHAKGIVIGISGGKDSTVAAALCVKAIGKENVLGVLMPNGEQKDIEDSIEICEFLGISYRIVNIQPAYEAINNMIRYSEKYKENEHIDSFFPLSPHTLTNVPPRIRMSVLYAIGQEMGYRVCGTGNASETYIGYFTKWGDGASDFNPIGNFTMDEVVAIGNSLGLPRHLVEKTPSDGLCGKSDEENFGFSYKELNDYIHGENDIDKEVMIEIEKLHYYNLHKVEPIPKF